MSELKDRIKSIRTNVGLTQADFGGIIGVSYGSVSQWERGITTPDEPLIRLMCKEYGVNYGWLTKGVGPTYKSELPSDTLFDKFCAEYHMDSPDEKELVRNLLSMTSAQRRQLIDLFHTLLGKNKTQSK